MTPLERFLQEEIAAGSFPGGSALVASGDQVFAEAAAGDACVEPGREPATLETAYDLASLTKPLCTGALAACAGETLPLESAPGRYLPEWKRTRFEGITLEHLLTHTSGLAAWFPLYVRGEGAAAYRRTLGELEPEARPGERVTYSDLNFLVLGDILEVVLGASPGRVVRRPRRDARRLARPLPSHGAPLVCRHGKGRPFRARDDLGPGTRVRPLPGRRRTR